MVKSKLALIIDSLFISTLFSVISFLWLRRIIKNANLVYFFSILINLSLFVLILFLFLKSHNKKLFKNNNEKFINNCMNFLLVCDYKSYIEFLAKLTSSKHIEGFIFESNNNFLYINLKTELSPSDYFNAQELFLKNKNNDSKLFFIFKNKSKQFDELLLLSNLNLSLISSDTIIKLMNNKNLYPIQVSEQAKQNIKQKINLFIKSKTKGITKSHFKELFFSGISLLFISLVIPFSNYYLILGSILLIISIISLFKKDIKPTEDKTDFLFK